jgi:hypothetical protein
MKAGDPAAGHGRCGGRTRRGTLCRQPAGHGTGHPGVGRCSFHAGATPNGETNGRRLLAEQACAVLGVPIRTTPQKALQDELNRTNGAVEWLRVRVAELTFADIEQGSVWLALYQEERDHLVTVCKVMSAANIPAQAVDAAREQGTMFAQLLDRVLNAIQVTGEQRDRLPEVMPAVLECLPWDIP